MKMCVYGGRDQQLPGLPSILRAAEDSSRQQASTWAVAGAIAFATPLLAYGARSLSAPVQHLWPDSSALGSSLCDGQRKNHALNVTNFLL